MKIKTGYMDKGNCWKFQPSFNRYWKNKIWWFGFWRFYFTIDFRKNWLADMIPNQK